MTQPKAFPARRRIGVALVALMVLAAAAKAQQMNGGGSGGGGGGSCAGDINAGCSQVTGLHLPATTYGDVGTSGAPQQIASGYYRVATAAATSFTQNRYWVLPAASSLPSGAVLIVSDDAGAVGTYSLTIARNGSDTINGGSQTPLTVQYAAVGFKTNGSNAWTIVDSVTLADLQSGQIYVGNASNQTIAVSPSGGATIGVSGVVTLGDPGPSTLGGVESIAAVSHEFLTGISTGGVPSQAQPGFTDLAGSASSAQMSTNLSAALDAAVGSTQGDLLYRGASTWSALAPGTSGYFLETQGSAANPQWASASSSGTLTLTDGTHTVAAVTQVTVTGGTVGGTSPNATVTISGGGGSPGGSTNAVQYNAGSSTFGGVSLSANQILVGQAGAPVAETFGGDVTLSGGTVTVASLNGGYGISPQGRVSDSSTSCAHVTDATNIQTLYYVPCAGALVPISTNGTSFALYAIPSTSTNLSTANATNFPANTIFDVYAFIHSSAVTYCAVPWGTSTAGGSARGTGASSAAVTQLLGIWVNADAPSCYNGGTTYTLTADEATLLGSFVTTGTAEDVAMQFNAAAANGGPSGGAFIGYANIYNQLPAKCNAYDSTGSWTYATETWEAMDAGASGSGLYNRCNWVDPLGTIAVDALAAVPIKEATGGNNAQVGIGINSTSAVTGTAGDAAETQYMTVMAFASVNAPQSAGGLNYAQALQYGNTSGTVTYAGVNNNSSAQAEGLTLRGKY